jgi:nitrate reductase delta subunit
MKTPVLAPVVPVRLDAHGRAVAHMAASILLDYPSADVLARYDDVRAAIGSLPGPVRERFERFLDAAAVHPDLPAHYVATFDLKRKCALYLTYFGAGDTRRRGMSLVAFVEAYRAAGWVVEEGELPDYLPVVLEFSARGDATIAGGLLATHRQGLEVLRSAVAGVGSPYADLVEAVCLTLPPVDAETERRYLELISAGPPTEMVGLSDMGPLEPFAPGGAENVEVRR